MREVLFEAKRANPCCPERSRYIRLVRDRGPVYITPGPRDELRTSGTTVISSPASCRLCGTSSSCVSSAHLGLPLRFPTVDFYPRLPVLLPRESSADSIRVPRVTASLILFLDRDNLKRMRRRDRRAALPRAHK